VDAGWREEDASKRKLKPILIRSEAEGLGVGKGGTRMSRNGSPKRSAKPLKPSYILDEQIGFILRQVSQRHAVIFSREIGINLTPTQWAAVSKLAEAGPCSQNQLGRLTSMDVATIKGVIDRLTARGLTETSPDPEDGRRLQVKLTRAGQQLAEKATPNALAISRETLAPLDVKERETFVALLSRLR
jgi:DNA-binding MarR family transcriptional regulator